jgi:hypothetical protein
MASLLNSSIGRKFLMALSALFLIVFLIVHVSINLVSLFSVEAFNDVSHFMGTNFFIQKLNAAHSFRRSNFSLCDGIYFRIPKQKGKGRSWLRSKLCWKRNLGVKKYDLFRFSDFSFFSTSPLGFLVSDQ